MLRSIPLLTALVLFGCNTKASYHAPAELKPENAATLKVAARALPFVAAVHPVEILYIDGKKGPDAPAYGGKWGDLLLAPGPHALVVGYNDGGKYSVMNAVIRFEAQAGKTYDIFDWPPVLSDVTDPRLKRAVKQTVVPAGRDRSGVRGY